MAHVKFSTKADKISYLKGLQAGTRTITELHGILDPSKLTNEELQQCIELCKKYGSDELALIQIVCDDPKDLEFIKGVQQALIVRPTGYGNPFHPNYYKREQ